MVASVGAQCHPVLVVRGKRAVHAATASCQLLVNDPMACCGGEVSGPRAERVMAGSGKDTAAASSLMREIAGHAGKLGIEICDISGHVEEVAARIKRQAQLLVDL